MMPPFKIPGNLGKETLYSLEPFNELHTVAYGYESVLVKMSFIKKLVW